MKALVQEHNAVCMMVGTFTPETSLVMEVSDVGGVNISIMCNEIVTNKHYHCSHLFSCYTLVVKIILVHKYSKYSKYSKYLKYHTLVLFEI